MQCDDSDPVLKFVALTDHDLARVDPVELNLGAAAGIPELADLDVARYQRQVDAWAAVVEQRCRAAEPSFHAEPGAWKDDIGFFRLVILAGYIDQELAVRYREDQRDLNEVIYDDASDLFLNGVMDSRRGTCANMAVLHVALAWRLGWPLALATVRGHMLCRLASGALAHNVEATNTGRGGVQSDPDEDYFGRGLPRRAVTCGSDLRALSPREMLGLFVGLRARYWNNTGRYHRAEEDYLLARWLFPRNRYLYAAQVNASAHFGMELFDPGEPDHPSALLAELQACVAAETARRPGGAVVPQWVSAIASEA